MAFFLCIWPHHAATMSVGYQLMEYLTWLQKEKSMSFYLLILFYYFFFTFIFILNPHNHRFLFILLWHFGGSTPSLSFFPFSVWIRPKRYIVRLTQVTYTSFPVHSSEFVIISQSGYFCSDDLLEEWAGNVEEPEEGDYLQRGLRPRHHLVLHWIHQQNIQVRWYQESAVPVCANLQKWRTNPKQVWSVHYKSWIQFRLGGRGRDCLPAHSEDGG